MNFIDENNRDNGLRPNIWVACSRRLPIMPSVILKTAQVIIIKLDTIKGVFYLGFIHAANSYVERRQWHSLMPFSGWNVCLVGDYNAIIETHEQVGHKHLHKISCDEFRVFIADAGFFYLNTSGPFFTWRCSHTGPILALRLDRTLVSERFSDFWAAISV